MDSLVLDLASKNSNPFASMRLRPFWAGENQSGFEEKALDFSGAGAQMRGKYKGPFPRSPHAKFFSSWDSTLSDSLANFVQIEVFTISY
jgi:hypothetical protein